MNKTIIVLSSAIMTLSACGREGLTNSVSIVCYQGIEYITARTGGYTNIATPLIDKNTKLPRGCD